MKYKHLPNLSVEAHFSPCGRYRYLLEIDAQTFETGKTLLVIMQNPSDASEVQADKSVQFLEKLVFLSTNGYFKEVNKMFIVNQYAFIQKSGFEGSAKKVGPENDGFIRIAVEESDLILIAWGKNNPYMDRQRVLMQLFSKYKDKLILKTKKHPSRGFYTDFIVPVVLDNTLD